jgi:hypothetical protein
MATKEKLAFLKAHPEELSPNILRQLKEEIVAQKKNKAADEASTKAKGSGQQPGSAREEIPVSQQKLKPPQASAKPLTWIHPTLAVRWKPSLGTAPGPLSAAGNSATPR